MYYELSPAYGRDYAKASEVVEAFNQGQDFVGDYNLGFQYVSRRDLPEGSSVVLRYGKLRKVTTAKV